MVGVRGSTDGSVKMGQEIKKISHKNYLQKMSIIPSAFFAFSLNS